MGDVVDFPAGAVCPSKQDPETCDHIRIIPLDETMIPTLNWDEEPEFYGVVCVWERETQVHYRIIASFVEERYACKFAVTINPEVRTGFDDELADSLREAILEVSFAPDEEAFPEARMNTLDDFFVEIMSKIEKMKEDEKDESH